MAIAARRHTSELLGRTSEAEIAYGGQVYRLRCTGLGKLILTR